MEKVSIVIRSKNEESWMSKVIFALKKQSYKNVEFVLVDNESTDRTIDIFKSLVPNGIIKRIGQFYPGKAINVGIEASTSELVVILSAHCIPTNEHWLESFVQTMHDNSIGACYGRQIPLETSHPLDKRDLLNTFGIEFRIQKKDSFFHNANSIIRKSIWRKIPFDEDVKHIEDRLWAQKILKENHWIAYQPNACVFHHHGINHHQNINRAENISNILTKSDLKDIDFNLSNVTPYQNGSYLVSILGYSQENHGYFEEIYHFFKSFLTNIKFYVHIENNSKFENVPDVKISFRNESNNHLSFVDILQCMLNEYENECELFDGIIYINLKRKMANFSHILPIVKYYYEGAFDSVFPAIKEFSNVWIASEGMNYKQLNSNYLSRDQKKPIFLAVYGSGTITRPKFIRNLDFIGENVGIIDLN